MLHHLTHTSHHVAHAHTNSNIWDYFVSQSTPCRISHGTVDLEALCVRYTFSRSLFPQFRQRHRNRWNKNSLIKFEYYNEVKCCSCPLLFMIVFGIRNRRPHQASSLRQINAISRKIQLIIIRNMFTCAGCAYMGYAHCPCLYLLPFQRRRNRVWTPYDALECKNVRYTAAIIISIAFFRLLGCWFSRIKAECAFIIYIFFIRWFQFVASCRQRKWDKGMQREQQQQQQKHAHIYKNGKCSLRAQVRGAERLSRVRRSRILFTHRYIILYSILSDWTPSNVYSDRN